MNIKIMLSKSSKNLFYVIPGDADTSILPESVEIIPFKEFELEADDPRIAMDPRQCLNDIDEIGYHVIDQRSKQ